MAVKNRFISNKEAAPVVETDVFKDAKDRQFALICFGMGLRENDPLFDAYLRLRANVYVDQTGMLPKEAVRDDGTEIDSDDDRSVSYLVLENLGQSRAGKIQKAAAVSCMRLIHANGDSLPVGDFFGVEVEPSALEASRFISTIDNKPNQLRSIFEIFKSGLAYVKQEELGPVYAVVEPELQQSLAFLGAPPEQLSDPKHVGEYNDINVGIKIDTDDMIEKMGGMEAIRQIDVSPDAVRYWGKYADISDEQAPNLRIA
jgi:N-acyl-L-homoserine lactone synthetase